MNIYSETSNDNTEQEKTYIERGQLFEENDTESQRVLECFHCGGDYVNEIHVTFCQTASKYVMENTCLICDAEGESPHDTVKHVREHHLNVICEFIEDENSEKSKDIIGINFKSQNQEESSRDDNERLSQQPDHEIEELGDVNEEPIGETIIQNQVENNIFNESSLHSQIEIGNEIHNIEEMKVEVIKFEPNVPEKDQSSMHDLNPEKQKQIETESYENPIQEHTLEDLANVNQGFENEQSSKPNLHPQKENQNDTKSNENAIQEHTLEDSAIVNQGFENEQSTPEIQVELCVKEQAEDQLDLELDGMEILPHD